TFYFVYYRYVFAFDRENRLRWARMLQQDVIGAQPLANGLLTVGERGASALLDVTTGNDRWTGAIPGELASVAIDAQGFDPGGQAGEARDLRHALNEIALDPDNRLVPAR